MSSLETVAADTPIEELQRIFERDGALIVADAMSPQLLAQTLEEVMPYVLATAPGRDGFTGYRTTRTGALVARSPACRTLVMDPLVRAMCDAVLLPNCERYQLHLTQVIRIMSGQTAQPIHRDRWAWGARLRGLEPQLNTIWALTPFTSANGATQVVPGSTGWPDQRQATPEEIGCAEMAAGSVLIYSGSVFHGGGANHTDGDRIGLNITYALGWLRQEENQYLSYSIDEVRAMPERVQKLLGYEIGAYALGYIDGGRSPMELLRDPASGVEPTAHTFFG